MTENPRRERQAFNFGNPAGDGATGRVAAELGRSETSFATRLVFSQDGPGPVRVGRPSTGAVGRGSRPADGPASGPGAGLLPGAGRPPVRADPGHRLGRWAGP